jgi:acetolactate synthase regulatory subunit
MEYLRFCEKIVEKIYDPKRGSRIAIFNTVADRGFSAWRVQQSAMRATMENNIQFRIEQERKRPVTKKQVAQVMRSLKEVPEWLERFNQKHGITKT